MTNRPSITQLERLVDFLEQNPGIAKGLLRTTEAKLETKRKWARLANTLNSLGGVNKNGQGWAKYWAEKKCGLKKQCAQLSASKRRTGGGSAEHRPELSALDQRLVTVMGGQEFATTNSPLTVNPFPSREADSPAVTEESTSLPEDSEMKNDDTPIPGLSSSDHIIEVVVDGDIELALRHSEPRLTMTNRPSIPQLEHLVEFLEENPGIAQGLLRTTEAKLETKRKWARLANTLNSLGGVNKNGQGWAKYWAEKKCGLKKQCAQLSASKRRTGGRSAERRPELSALDQRFVAVMGGQEFSTGNSTLTVNPFPSRAADSPAVTEESTSLPKDIKTENDDIPFPGSSSTPVFTPLRSPLPSRHHSCSPTWRPPDGNMERFASIAERWVEAELKTAQAFAQLSQQIGNVASALTTMANAISDIARKMPDS